MRGFYGDALSGNCHVKTEACVPFPWMSCHILVGTVLLAEPLREQATLPGNVVIPRPQTYGLVGYPYNTRTEYGNSGKKMRHFFQAADLAAWGTRITYPYGPFYPMTWEGPPWTNVQCVLGLETRNTNARPWAYANRKRVYWTDADQYRRRNRTGAYVGLDWLGFLWPGDFLYAPVNVPQPMLGERYFEESGGVFSPTQAAAEYNFLEFSDPLPVYEDAAGTELLGHYAGLTFMPFFGACVVKRPFTPLPDDPTVPFPGADVNPAAQFVSLDLWFYLAAVPAAGKTLKSPRIATLRGWLPKSDIPSESGRNSSWCSQYLYLTFTAPDDYKHSFTPRLNFSLVGGGNTTRRVILSDFKAYLVA